MNISTIRERLEVRRALKADPYEEVYVLTGGTIGGFRVELPVSVLVENVDPNARVMPNKGMSRIQFTGASFLGSALVLSIVFYAFTSIYHIGSILGSVTLATLMGMLVGIGGFMFYDIIPGLSRTSGSPYWIVRSRFEEGGALRTITPVLHERNDVWKWFDASEEEQLEVAFRRESERSTVSGSYSKDASQNGQGAVATLDRANPAVMAALLSSSQPRTNTYDAAYMFEKSKMRDLEIAFRGGISGWQKVQFAAYGAVAVSLGLIAVFFGVAIRGG